MPKEAETKCFNNEDGNHFKVTLKANTSLNRNEEELIDLIETIEAPIVDKLTELGFELEEDFGEVEVSKDGIAIVSYDIYIVENEALIDITVLDSQLSEQVIEAIKQSF